MAGTPTKTKLQPGEAGIERYRALLFAAQNYAPGSKMPRLDSPIRDVEEIGRVLRDSYGFEVEIVRDATRRDIVSRLDALVASTDRDDAVLIYYAGHGFELPDEHRSYWLPVDASTEDTSNWIGHDTVRAKLRSMPARHVLLFVDSCFAGRFRAVSMPRRGPAPASSFDDLLKKTSRSSRVVITSGANEPVMDSGRDGMSVFAYHLRQGLLEAESRYVEPEPLYYDVRNKVISRSQQAPTMSRLSSDYDEGGSLVMVNQDSCTHETAVEVSERVEQARKAWNKVDAKDEDRVRAWLDAYGRPHPMEHCGRQIEVSLAPELTAQAEGMLRGIGPRRSRAAIPLVVAGGGIAVGGAAMVGAASAWWRNNQGLYTVADDEVLAPSDEAAARLSRHRTLSHIGLGVLAAGVITAGVGGRLFLVPSPDGTGLSISYELRAKPGRL